MTSTTTSKSSSDSFELASQAFLTWFTTHPATTFHSSLSIRDLRSQNAGRGIIATSDIPAETDLFTIPRSAIISVETSDLAKALPELFESSSSTSQNDDRDDNADAMQLEDEVGSLPTPWLNLILVLLHEMLRPESKWGPYLSILPSRPQDFNTLIFWTPNELQHLQTSAMASKIGRDTADAIFRSRILPVVNQHASTFYGTSDISKRFSEDELMEKCHVIGSLIMSYAFELYPDDDESDDEADANGDGWTEDIVKPTRNTMGMIPMADMLNADAEFNAHLSHGDDALTMTSLKLIKAGEEVLNYYGPLPNGELLRRYGYTSPKHARYDVVEIGWDLVKTCVVEEVKATMTGQEAKVLEVLREAEEEEDHDTIDGFLLERESGDPTEEGLCPHEAKFTVFPEELVDVLSEVLRAVLASSNKKNRVSEEEKARDLKRRVLLVLQRIVETRTKSYGTSIEEDEEILTRENVKGRPRMAVEVRVGEKRILKEAGEWVRDMLRKYAPIAQNGESSTKKAGGPAGSGQPPAKKQKRGR